MTRAAAGAVCAFLISALPVAAQGVDMIGTDSVTVAAQEAYGANPFRRLFFGSDYRRLWTTPMRVPVLDLGGYAGGLTPIQRGGGQQTRSLRLRAGNGRQFTFRSVDKDPSAILPPELRETLAASIVQDQISSAHPVGALLVSPILDAVGVLHAVPQLAVLPDDPALGEYREEFAGMLGLLEERPDENDGDLAAFHGASAVVGTPRLLEGIEEDLELVDTRAFLAARLTDLFLGDWDRHSDQWRWARFGDAREDSWKPIPRDRDQAFVRHDGFLLWLTRMYFPQLVRFDEGYPSMVGLTWNGRDMDRRLLVDLEWPVWDSVATALERQLTDDVIDTALGRLPSELRALDGGLLRRRMIARRDGLRAVARRFYELLAEEPEIHSTDAAEIVDAYRPSPSQLEVTITARESEFGPVEVFRRTFLALETNEVRLMLHGGADSVRVHGVSEGIDVRVVGGGGSDVFVDEAGGAHFYDTGGQTEVVMASGTTVDTRDFEPPPISPSPLNRDWGSWNRFPIRIGFAPDVGFVGGLTAEHYDFGFRKVPHAAAIKVGGAWGTTPGAYQLDGEVSIYRENSGVHGVFRGRASGLEILRFHGFGNETVVDRPDGDYKVEQRQFRLEQEVVVPFSDHVTLGLGPVVQFAKTDRPPNWLSGQALPYGMGDFGQIGLQADLTLEGRDRARAATSGAMLQVEGRVYPAAWDVEETFGQVAGSAAAYLTPFAELQPTLALRVGASKNFGAYPFHEAAFLGSAETVRLGREQRFAGDAMAHANAELRLKLFRATIVLPADIGVFGLYDVGRVWLDGESSNQWHDAFGGGLWLAYLQPAECLHGRDRTERRPDGCIRGSGLRLLTACGVSPPP